MQNIELLFEKNRKAIYKIKITKGQIIFINKDSLFTGKNINTIIEFINAIHFQYPGVRMPIFINLGDITFIDKLTFVFLECICYSLIDKYRQEVHIFSKVKKSIGTEGAYSSPLLLLNSGKIDNMIKFKDKFKKDTYGYHLRRVISGKDRDNTNFLGELFEEIDSFLTPFGVQDDCKDDISKVIVELVGNSCEHGISDCLIDVDVTGDYSRRVNDIVDSDDYYGINIVVLNFSDKLIGDGIKRKIAERFDCDGRYKNIYSAYEYHKSKFSSEYLEEDFYNITAFQHKISGREHCESTGGTGLTQLIKSLEKRSSAHKCYMISGGRAVHFLQNTIDFDEDNWVGFNKAKNYINGIPEKRVISECYIYMPGTAFNLNFVMKGKKIYGKED
jgi:hypothetical protein